MNKGSGIIPKTRKLLNSFVIPDRIGKNLEKKRKRRRKSEKGN